MDMAFSMVVVGGALTYYPSEDIRITRRIKENQAGPYGVSHDFPVPVNCDSGKPRMTGRRSPLTYADPKGCLQNRLDSFDEMIYIDISQRKEGFVETTAKLFQNGRSQAVRLPRAFRFKGKEVRIRREENKVILEPLEPQEWPEGFWDIFQEDPDFEVPAPLAGAPVDLDGGA